MPKRPHIIVFGNEKGGTGKSTAAMHVAVGLLRLGYRVGTMDLDSHQGTFTAYIRNRWDYLRETGEDMPMPEHIHLDRAGGANLFEKRDQERWRVEAAIDELSLRNDFIVMDTPGSDRFMSIVGHSFADTLVTPMNDSFVDLDLLARIDHATHAVKKISVYTDMVQDLRRQRAKRDGHDLRWFVMRNRLSHLESLNGHDVDGVLRHLSARLGFSIAPGFGERVIFRELFLKGLTLLDMKNKMTLSNIAARQEVRHLIRTILPEKDVSTLSLLQTA